ncbi:MAG: Gx transporter family protein [Lachnospiraceae bacterium]|nr:Gx transporter family protein [Lachnospiraceae bacterium]
MKHKVAYMGVFVALAMILSYVESLLPYFFSVPGMKLGLTNVLVVIALYFWGPKEAFCINLVRIILMGLLFGNGVGFAYSLAGGITSFVAMYLFKKIEGLHVIFVSAAGGIFHNVGQVLIGSILVANWTWLFYTPFLLAGGIFTGSIVGLISALVLSRLKTISSIPKE